MANRTFQTQFLHVPKRLGCVYFLVSVGAAGAITLQRRTFANGNVSRTNAATTGTGYAVGNGEGVRSVTRTGTGAWTVILSDSYVYMVGAELVRTLNSGGVPTVAQIGVDTDTTDIQTNSGVGNGGLIALKLVGFDGLAVDPASGDFITVRITFGDATES